MAVQIVRSEGVARIEGRRIFQWGGAGSFTFRLGSSRETKKYNLDMAFPISCTRCVSQDGRNYFRSADNTLRAFSIPYGPADYLWTVEFDGAPVTWSDEKQTVASSALPSVHRLLPNRTLWSKDQTASVRYSKGCLTWWCAECSSSTLQRPHADSACGQPRILVQFCDPIKPGGWIVHVPSLYGCGMHGLLPAVVVRIYRTFHEAHAVLWQCERRIWAPNAFEHVQLQPEIEFRSEATMDRQLAERYALATGATVDAMPSRGAFRSKQSKGKIGHHHGQIACPCTDASTCPVKRLTEVYRAGAVMQPSCSICGGPSQFCHPADDPCWEALSLFDRIGQGTAAAPKPVMFSLCVAAA